MLPLLLGLRSLLTKLASLQGRRSLQLSTQHILALAVHHIISSPSSSGLDSLAQQSCHSCGRHDGRDAVEVEEVDDLLSVWLCPADCTPLHWVSWLIGSGVHNAAENADIIGLAAKLTPGYTRVFFISGRTFVTYCCHWSAT